MSFSQFWAHFSIWHCFAVIAGIYMLTTTLVALYRMRIRHVERLALIQQGKDPSGVPAGDDETLVVEEAVQT